MPSTVLPFFPSLSVWVEMYWCHLYWYVGNRNVDFCTNKLSWTENAPRQKYVCPIGVNLSGTSVGFDHRLSHTHSHVILYQIPRNHKLMFYVNSNKRTNGYGVYDYFLCPHSSLTQETGIGSVIYFCFHVLCYYIFPRVVLVLWYRYKRSLTYCSSVFCVCVCPSDCEIGPVPKQTADRYADNSE